MLCLRVYYLVTLCFLTRRALGQSAIYRYASAYMIQNPEAPIPTTSNITSTVTSITICAAICSSKADCLGYSYVQSTCTLYHDVIYYEDLSSDQSDEPIHYEVSKITHPFECPKKMFPLADVGQIKLTVKGHGPYDRRPGNHITLELLPKNEACGPHYIKSIYEYDYYEGDDFYDNEAGASRRILGSCPEFQLTDYDYDGSSNLEAKQLLQLANSGGTWDLLISWTGLSVDDNLAMWGYQLEFISDSDSSTLATMVIPQFSLPRSAKT